MKTCKACLQTKPLDLFTWGKNPRLRAGGEYKSECKVCMNARTKAWYAQNRDRALATQAAWRDANKARWNTRMNVATAKRRAAKLKAVPSWADHDLMADLYTYAAIMRSFGVPAEVDHIVPLQAELACGFHSHDNLTVILSSENRSKRNSLAA